MSRLATHYDNARAESFMKTLKYEEVYRTEYRDLEECRGCGMPRNEGASCTAKTAP
jgi:hypothetical protein